MSSRDMNKKWSSCSPRLLRVEAAAFSSEELICELNDCSQNNFWSVRGTKCATRSSAIAAWVRAFQEDFPLHKVVCILPRILHCKIGPSSTQMWKSWSTATSTVSSLPPSINLNSRSIWGVISPEEFFIFLIAWSWQRLPTTCSGEGSIVVHSNSVPLREFWGAVSLKTVPRHWKCSIWLLRELVRLELSHIMIERWGHGFPCPGGQWDWEQRQHSSLSVTERHRPHISRLLKRLESCLWFLATQLGQLRSFWVFCLF